MQSIMIREKNAVNKFLGLKWLLGDSTLIIFSNVAYSMYYASKVQRCCSMSSSYLF